MKETTQTQPAALAALNPQGVQAIAQLGPQAVSENTLSRDRCTEAARRLLSRIEEQGGMSESLDLEAATLIERAKKTVRKMNERRAPVTKIFDEVRAAFTALEAEVNPASKDSLPARLQEHRNRFAAAKRAEALRIQQQEAERIARQRAEEACRAEAEEAFKAAFNAYTAACTARISALDASLTTANYEETFESIKRISGQFDEEWFAALSAPTDLFGGCLPAGRAEAIASEVKQALHARFAEQFTFEIADYRDTLLERLPSKLAELRRMEQASAEEARQIKAEMEARERAEQLRRAEVLREAEEREKEQARIAQSKQEMDSLFGAAQATLSPSQPRTQVKKRIEVMRPEGFMEVVGLWWSQYGSSLSVEELSKIFSRQITFCNRLANDKARPILIHSPHVSYVEDVKAK